MDGVACAVVKNATVVCTASPEEMKTRGAPQQGGSMSPFNKGLPKTLPPGTKQQILPVQGQKFPCPTCSGPVARRPVYALGRISPRFPSLAVEKEFAQVTGKAGSEGLLEKQNLNSVLQKRENR